jgi:hypothetical protein
MAILAEPCRLKLTNLEVNKPLLSGGSGDRGREICGDWGGDGGRCGRGNAARETFKNTGLPTLQEKSSEICEPDMTLLGAL